MSLVAISGNGFSNTRFRSPRSVPSNGPMNVLDQVLVPPVTPDLTLNTANLTELQKALVATNLMPAVNTLPGITVYVERAERRSTTRKGTQG